MKSLKQLKRDLRNLRVKEDEYNKRISRLETHLDRDDNGDVIDPNGPVMREVRKYINLSVNTNMDIERLQRMIRWQTTNPTLGDILEDAMRKKS